MKISFRAKVYALLFVVAALSACNTVPMGQRIVEQQNLKAAQQGSPFRWKYQATPGGGSMMTRYLIEALDNPERWDFSFDSRTWELGSHAKGEAMALREYVLKGQSIDNWSELVSSNWGFSNEVSVQQIQEKVIASLKEDCDSFEMFIIKSSSDDLIYEWKHDQPCKGWPAQHEIRRIKSVDGHLAMLSYAIKTKKIDEALRSEWVKRISAATIKKIELGSLSKKPDLTWLENRNTYYKEIIEKYGYSTDETLTEEGTRLVYKYPDTGTSACNSCGTITFVFAKTSNFAKPLQGFSVIDTELNEVFNKGCKLLVQRNFTEATPLIRQAAEAHHSDAQNSLGLMYINGDGVERSYVEAFKWFRRAAAAGHTGSQYDLGAMYRNGEGMNENKDAAKFLYTLAANKGHAMAAYELAKIYQSDGDITNSKKWFENAKKNGYLPPIQL